uniref:LRAT domain-containing protein n=1 Tax=Angiostrongylus cantonensis TaxID=6313 RepID=A0A0K0D3F1_ANGCA
MPSDAIGSLIILSLLLLVKQSAVTAQHGVTYKEPELECLDDGIRLHIHPVGVFVGHVYVMGHFAGEYVHSKFYFNF